MTKLNTLMIQKLLLNIWLIWMISIKILNNTIQTKDEKYQLFSLLSNKKLNSIVAGLFIRGRKLNISLVFITQFISLLQKIQHTILLWKFQTKENFNKLHLNIRQILTFKTLWIFIKSVLQTMFFFGYWYYSCIR